MKLALGTVQFGLPYGIANHAGQVTRAEAKATLELASAKGIDTLDTAIAYGESETCLGEVGIQGFNLVTKLPSVPDSCADVSGWVREQINGSFTRLGVDSAYGLLLHHPQQLLEKNGDKLYRALQQLKQNGLVEKVGVSIYDPSELDAICGRFQFDLVQAPFNIFDRRLIDTGWLTRLAELDTESHVRSVFLQGLLLMPRQARPVKFTRWDSLWNVWDDWLDQNGLTPVQACLRYALLQPEIDRVVIGVDNSHQLVDIISAADGGLPELHDALRATDTDLLNPSRWPALA